MDRQLGKPVIPTSIIVHLGAPEVAARNITISFIDYVKNVACSEIYPTWPENAIRANILAQISFVMNRIYSEWYPSRGYLFDVTNHTSYDQKFIEGRNIFDNISKIVDEIFNNYVVKGDQVQPYFCTYCDGLATVCKGLSQWGTVDLAKQGKTPLQILQAYYGSDITIIQDAQIGEHIATYPGTPLKLGDISEHIRIIKRQLNRIAINYPAIPRLEVIHEYYDVVTERTVKKFQEIFNLTSTGIIDKATWYKVKYLYTSVKKLGDLYSEGVLLEDVELKYDLEIEVGDSGLHVQALHYYLSVIAYFDDSIPKLPLDTIYDENTKAMVLAFQAAYSLPGTGVLNIETWNKLRQVYQDLFSNLPKEALATKEWIYPGRYLSLGMRGDDVSDLQRLLRQLAIKDSSLKQVTITGCYDTATEEAIKYLQHLWHLEETGGTGPLEWREIVRQVRE